MLCRRVLQASALKYGKMYENVKAIQVLFSARTFKTRFSKIRFFHIVWPWLPELAIFELEIRFLIKSCVYFTLCIYRKPSNIRFVHGFSKAGFGHAFLFFLFLKR